MLPRIQFKTYLSCDHLRTKGHVTKPKIKSIRLNRGKSFYIVPHDLLLQNVLFLKHMVMGVYLFRSLA